MADIKNKVVLVHGDCDYLVFKELKSIKKNLNTNQVSVNEIFGTKSLDFTEVYNALSSSDLFQNSSAVIIRDLTDGRSFFPFVEKLVNYLDSEESLENTLYLINPSKVLKTSKLFKTVTKHGEIKECNQPKPAEVLDMIKKSLAITQGAAQLLFDFSNANLFQIKNEIEKLKNYRLAKNKETIDVTDVETICLKSFSQNEVWGVGTTYLHWKLDPENKKMQSRLMKEIDDLLINNVPVMQLLYSFYQNVLNALKFAHASKMGRIKSERDAFAYGYFFVKEFYNKRNAFDFNKLMQWNSDILSIEYGIKSGELDEVIGLKKLTLMR